MAIFAFILGSQHPLPLRTVKTELVGEGRKKEEQRDSERRRGGRGTRKRGVKRNGGRERGEGRERVGGVGGGGI